VRQMFCCCLTVSILRIAPGLLHRAWPDSFVRWALLNADLRYATVSTTKTTQNRAAHLGLTLSSHQKRWASARHRPTWRRRSTHGPRAVPLREQEGDVSPISCTGPLRY
jgi:hypothetical protein